MMISSTESLLMSTDVRTFCPWDMAWGMFTSQTASSTKLSQGSANGTPLLIGFQMLTLCTKLDKCDLAKKITNPVNPDFMGKKF